MKNQTLIAPKAHIFFDFDYTIVPEESPLQVLRLALKGHKKEHSVLEVLNRMDSKSNASQVGLSEIWPLLKAPTYVKKKHVEQYIQQSLKEIDPVIPKLFSRLQNLGYELYILSAGFQECIKPIGGALGIPQDNIMANQFIWLGNRVFTFRPKRLLLKGKSNFLKKWLAKREMSGPIIMVGDSSSDFKVYQKGLAKGFVSADYYTPNPLDLPTDSNENIRRAKHPDELLDQILATLDH